MKNIIILCADQLRKDAVHHLGCEVETTPNLDKFSKDSISFENCFVQNPVCTPSRCSFLTGWYPHTKGHRTMHYLTNQNEFNIFKELKREGYYVKWIGKNDFFKANEDYSSSVDSHFIPKANLMFNEFTSKLNNLKKDDGTFYDFYYGEVDAKIARDDFDWQCFDETMKFLDEKHDKPYCLFLPWLFPHPEYYVEEPFFSKFNKEEIKDLLPRELVNQKPLMLQEILKRQNINYDMSELKKVKACYYGMLNRLDYQFGLIVNKLKELNEYDDSLIIFMSDHGDFTGDYGITEKCQNVLEECLVNVPLIIKPPKDFKINPRVSSTLVEMLDLPKTISKIVGFDLSYDEFGKDLTEVFLEDKDLRSAVYSEGGRLNYEFQAAELGHNESSHYYPRLSAQALDNVHGKATMCRTKDFKYVKRLYEEDEFYDLRNDPNATINVIEKKEYQDEILKHKELMLDWYMRTCDVVPRRKDKRF